MSTLPSLAMTILMLGAPAAAQNTLTGTWQGETNAGASVQIDLTAKGTTLTGTLTRNGRSTPISDGKVSKDTFTFKATLNEQSEGFSGERSGDELRVWLDRQGRETAIVLRRAKGAAPER
jgi:hypothetical protein